MPNGARAVDTRVTHKLLFYLHALLDKALSNKAYGLLKERPREKWRRVTPEKFGLAYR